MSLYTPSQPYLRKSFLNVFFICFSSLTVCFLGWLWGRRDLFTNDYHVPLYLLHQCFTLDNLTPYLRLASLFPFLIALSTTACFFLASCVIIFMKSTYFLVNGFVANFIIPYLKLLLFFVGSYHFSIYRLKSMFMQFYIYFTINL